MDVLMPTRKGIDTIVLYPVKTDALGAIWYKSKDPLKCVGFLDDKQPASYCVTSCKHFSAQLDLHWDHEYPQSIVICRWGIPDKVKRILGRTLGIYYDAYHIENRVF